MWSAQFYFQHAAAGSINSIEGSWKTAPAQNEWIPFYLLTCFCFKDVLNTHTNESTESTFSLSAHIFFHMSYKTYIAVLFVPFQLTSSFAHGHYHLESCYDYIMFHISFIHSIYLYVNHCFNPCCQLFSFCICFLIYLCSREIFTTRQGRLHQHQLWRCTVFTTGPIWLMWVY